MTCPRCDRSTFPCSIEDLCQEHQGDQRLMLKILAAEECRIRAELKCWRKKSEEEPTLEGDRILASGSAKILRVRAAKRAAELGRYGMCQLCGGELDIKRIDACEGVALYHAECWEHEKASCL